MPHRKKIPMLIILAALFPLWSAGHALAADAADTLYTGGAILTMNDAQATAEAVAVSDGRIVAVGALEDLRRFRDDDTQTVDLDGRALLPGFVDSHGHVIMGGLQALSANLLSPPDGEVRDIASLQETLREWVSANADAVESAGLIVGFGYDPAQLAELRHPTRDELDAVSTELPVIVVHQSGHFGAFNSLALERVEITAATPDPAGGIIRRRADGEPDGVLEENAFLGPLARLVGGLGPAPGSGRATVTPRRRKGAPCRTPWRSRARWPPRAVSTSIS